MPRSIPPTEAVVNRVRATTLTLPEAYEEDAWTGVRWCVRRKSFAHVLVVADGRPHSYARTASVDGPVTVLTFHSRGEELAFFAAAGAPYFKPVWSRTIVGMVIDDQTDWAEVRELLTDSYRVRAPRRLVGLLDEPPGVG